MIGSSVTDPIDLTALSDKQWAVICHDAVMLGYGDRQMTQHHASLYELLERLNIDKYRAGHLAYLETCYSAGEFHARSQETSPWHRITTIFASLPEERLPSM